MQIIKLNGNKKLFKIKNLIIGHFNVIHKGHLQLFCNTSNLSFLIFENNPSKKYQLYSLEERIKNLAFYKPDYIFIFDIAKDNCTANDFLNKFMIHFLKAQMVHVGSDFKFGNDLKTVSLLKQYYKVNVIEKNKNISTKKIVEYLENGEIEVANELMDRNFYYEGTVVENKKMAAKLFFPTANIYDNKKIFLKEGSYISQTFFRNKLHKSITFIGKPKSINDSKRFVETYIFDFYDNIYNEIIQVELLKFIRENQKFDNMDELIKMINNDLKIAKNFFKIGDK